MYDLVAGPKPADVVASPVPDENLQDTGVPGVVTGTPTLTDYGGYAVNNIVVQPDDSGNTNVVGATEIALGLYYVDELTTDLWASIDSAVNAATDPVTVNCTVNPATARVFSVGDFVVFNDEAADVDHAGRRSYERAQIVGPGNTGDVVPTGSFQFQRAYPGVPAGQATFGTLRCAHLAGVKFYKLDMKLFHVRGQEGLLPHAWAAAARRGEDPLRLRRGGSGRRGKPLRLRAVHRLSAEPSQRAVHARRPHVFGRRLHVPDPPVRSQRRTTSRSPLKVQNAASIRCVYAYLQQETSDGQSAYTVKYSTDGGATWNVLEKMSIAQSLPTAFKNTWDFLVAQGYGKPETRRLQYDDYGLVTIAPVTGSGVAQAVATASYDGSTSGLVPGDFVFLEFGLTNEEHVNVISVDTVNQTFTAIVTQDHPAGSSIRPSIWPTVVLLGGNDLAFDIKAVVSPSPGSDLTIVIQTSDVGTDKLQ